MAATSPFKPASTTDLFHTLATGSADSGRGAFAILVLLGLGIKPTQTNIDAMIGWQKAEGGNWNNTAKFNPLNTTRAAAGAGNTGTQGNIKVYRNWQQGVSATVATLRQRNFDGIRAALNHGSKTDIANAIDASPWGTHGPLIHNAIAQETTGLLPSQITPPDAAAGGVVGAPERAATAAVNAVGSLSDFLGLLTNPATWLRVLEFVGGLLLGFFALKQLASAAGSKA